MLVVESTPVWLEARRRRLGPDGLLSWTNLRRSPIDVEELARRLGVEVDFVSALDCSGSIVWDEHGPEPRAVMRVRAEDAEVHQRFTIAHELGHLMLHEGRLHQGWMYFRDTGRPPTDAGLLKLEAEANAFAAELLAPLWLFMPAMDVTNFDLEAVAKRFKISKKVASYRYSKAVGAAL